MAAGSALQARQDMSGALSHYQEAIAACHTYAPAHYNLGVL